MSYRQNLVIEQGSSFNTTIVLHNSNGDNITFSNTSTAIGTLRKTYSSANSVGFAVTLSNTGVNLSMDANTTAFIYPNNIYLYDVLVTDSATGLKTRIIEGQVRVTAAITDQVFITTYPYPIPPLFSNENSNFNVIQGTKTYYCDSSNGIIIATLPTGPTIGDIYFFKDVTGAAGNNPIELNGNGLNIDGSPTSNGFIQVAYGWGRVEFNGTQWSRIG
jgi:hypothetical protein